MIVFRQRVVADHDVDWIEYFSREDEPAVDAVFEETDWDFTDLDLPRVMEE